MKKLLLIMLATSLLAACTTSPTGRRQLMLISPDAAIVQSKQAYLSTVSDLDKENKLLDDPKMAKRVATITGRLVTEAIAMYPQSANWEWSVAIIDDPEMVNAWCMAGGRMAVYTGLFIKLKLTDAEFAIVKGHPVKGHAFLLAGANIDADALDVCLHHHEKVDGSGYPKGLAGTQISLFAKMGAVCDVYDAITSNRPYKAGWDPSESLRQMGTWASGHFDLTVFQAFAKTLGIYPVGSLVRLGSGRIGVVTEQSAGSLTMPVVKAFYHVASAQRIEPVLIDLSARGCTEKIIAREDPASWHFAGLDAMWSGLAL